MGIQALIGKVDQSEGLKQRLKLSAYTALLAVTPREFCCTEEVRTVYRTRRCAGAAVVLASYLIKVIMAYCFCVKPAVRSMCNRFGRLYCHRTVLGVVCAGNVDGLDSPRETEKRAEHWKFSYRL
jgi:hypothetical protein